MFDFDLQLRFWRSAMDSMMHGTQASLASAAAWQDQAAARTSASQRPQTVVYNPWAWMMPPQNDAWGGAFKIFEMNPFLAPMLNALKTPSNPFFPTQPAVAAWMPFGQTMTGSASGWTAPGAANFFPELMASFWTWPSSPWDLYRTPLTAMMMTAGLPYDVASPSAKAGTCAMDAADAARQQMDNLFSAYRSDGGHAAAQVLTLPWVFAASFAAGTDTSNAKQPQK